MHKIAKLCIVLILAGLVGWVVAARRRARARRVGEGGGAEAGSSAHLPLLLELGGEKCTACAAMAPVLAALKRDYAGQLRVGLVDVWKDDTAMERYDVMQIPTQIFYGPSGEELFRNEGFISREHIVAKWRQLGYELKGGGDEAMPALPRLFGGLTRFVRAAPAVALGASFVWGILSVLLSPCHLASIPLIVGFIDAQGRTTTRRAFVASSLFAVGILITIAAIGGITAAAGRALGSVAAWANWLVAAVFFVVGLHLLDVIPMPWAGPGQVGMTRRGLFAAFLLGLVFGIALGPCTFAYMAPMLGVTFKVAHANLAYGIVLLVAYGIGHCSVIVLAGTSTELVQRYLNWNERSKGSVVIKRLCGALVALGGVYLIYIAP